MHNQEQEFEALRAFVLGAIHDLASVAAISMFVCTVLLWAAILSRGI